MNKLIDRIILILHFTVILVVIALYEGSWDIEKWSVMARIVSVCYIIWVTIINPYVFVNLEKQNDRNTN